jgi:hypothetical protein
MLLQVCALLDPRLSRDTIVTQIRSRLSGTYSLRLLEGPPGNIIVPCSMLYRDHSYTGGGSSCPGHENACRKLAIVFRLAGCKKGPRGPRFCNSHAGFGYWTCW